MIVIGVSLSCSAAVAANSALVINYLALKSHSVIPSAMLDPPPVDEGIQGARVGVADDALTGRFLGQSFVLNETTADGEASLLDAARKLLAGGQRLFVADLPASALVKLADLPGANAAVIIDATNADDSLRGALCRADVLHTMPSRAMLADALMQYLVVKKWTRIMLLTGRDADDTLYADAVRASAAKFQITIKADRPWSFNPAAQQADTGHYEVNDEVAKATQDVTYDVLVVADEADNFGDELAYRTDTPRPVAGTSGLVPGAWSPVMDEYASTQLQLRFRRAAGRPMTNKDYGAWLAVRAIGEAATRTGATDATRLIAYLHGADFVLSGYKGLELSFRAWDGQLRQPVLLADARSLVSISPQLGFLHETNDLDSLGTDQPETTCHF
jgi:ABC transporter substrate binding protein (PQQ-dependent alcohol dehydrogenase system)